MALKAEKLGHLCGDCGYRSLKFFGRCVRCQAYATGQQRARGVELLRAPTPITGVPLDSGSAPGRASASSSGDFAVPWPAPRSQRKRLPIE